MYQFETNPNRYAGNKKDSSNYEDKHLLVMQMVLIVTNLICY
jgi:hypothetical protein